MILLLWYLLIATSSLIRGQTLSPSFSGCVTTDTHKNSVVIANNDTFADDSWWYQCIGTTLHAQGCVVDGQRFDVGDKFYAYGQAFYGQCEKIDDRYLKASILGCVDNTGTLVPPGRPYAVDRYFWANCTSAKKVVRSPSLGDVELDVISRHIIGCNDGTYDIAKDGDNFPEFITDKPLMAAIGVVCQLSGPHPQLKPVVCLVANSTVDQSYVPLSDKCYARFGHYLYYCSIEQHDWRNGTLEYSWQIGWNDYSAENVAALKAKSFQDCQNQVAQSRNSTSTSSRRKRDDSQDSSFSSFSMNRLFSLLEVPSRFIET